VQGSVLFLIKDELQVLHLHPLVEVVVALAGQGEAGVGINDPGT